jgi:hypothetical protein
MGAGLPRQKYMIQVDLGLTTVSGLTRLIWSLALMTLIKKHLGLHTRVAFFSYWRHMSLLLVYVFSFRHHLLSLRERPLLCRQQHSLSLLRRSLTRSVC